MPNRAVHRHALKRCGACLSARRASGDPFGRKDSAGKAVGVSASERCLSARRANGDPLGRKDSEAAGVGTNAVSVA